MRIGRGWGLVLLACGVWACGRVEGGDAPEPGKGERDTGVSAGRQRGMEGQRSSDGDAGAGGLPSSPPEQWQSTGCGSPGVAGYAGNDNDDEEEEDSSCWRGELQELDKWDWKPTSPEVVVAESCAAQSLWFVEVSRAESTCGGSVIRVSYDAQTDYFFFDAQGELVQYDYGTDVVADCENYGRMDCRVTGSEVPVCDVQGGHTTWYGGGGEGGASDGEHGEAGAGGANAR